MFGPELRKIWASFVVQNSFAANGSCGPVLGFGQLCIHSLFFSRTVRSRKLCELDTPFFLSFIYHSDIVKDGGV